MDFSEITTSEQTAVDDGISAMGATFGGIGNVIANNFLIAAIFMIPIISIGVSFFFKLMRRLGGRKV